MKRTKPPTLVEMATWLGFGDLGIWGSTWGWWSGDEGSLGRKKGKGKRDGQRGEPWRARDGRTKYRKSTREIIERGNRDNRERIEGIEGRQEISRNGGGEEEDEEPGRNRKATFPDQRSREREKEREREGSGKRRR